MSAIDVHSEIALRLAIESTANATATEIVERAQRFLEFLIGTLPGVAEIRDRDAPYG